MSRGVCYLKVAKSKPTTIDSKGEFTMTREAIEKLNENQLDYCKTLSSFIATHKKSGKKENLERYTGMLRGYI